MVFKTNFGNEVLKLIWLIVVNMNYYASFCTLKIFFKQLDWKKPDTDVTGVDVKIKVLGSNIFHSELWIHF